MKPTSFRFPPETLDLLNRLRMPGESQAAVIQRALIALDGQPPPLSVEALAQRIEGIESRLIALESSSEPVPHPDCDDFALAPAALPEPLSARDAEIIRLHASGESKRGIARQMGCSDSTVRNVLARQSHPAQERE